MQKQEVLTIHVYHMHGCFYSKAPENLINKSLGDTAAYLCSGFEDDTQKVRAIYTWLAMRQVTLDNIKKIDKRELCCKMFRKLCRY